MNEISATGVPYQSTDFLVGTVGKRISLVQTGKIASNVLVVVSFNGSESSVALIFNDNLNIVQICRYDVEYVCVQRGRAQRLGQHPNR